MDLGESQLVKEIKQDHEIAKEQRSKMTDANFIAWGMWKRALEQQDYFTPNQIQVLLGKAYCHIDPSVFSDPKAKEALTELMEEYADFLVEMFNTALQYLGTFEEVLSIMNTVEGPFIAFEFPKQQPAQQ